MTFATKKNAGFTLIELIAVIIILSLLNAVALPRFAAIQTEARIAKMNGALAALKAAAVLAHSIQLTQQLTPNTAVNMEGALIGMDNSYPTGLSIGDAAGLSSPDFILNVPVATATVFTVTPDANRPACAIIYNAALAGAQPTYDSTALTALNCA